MTYKFANQFNARAVAVIAGALLSTALAFPTHANEMWNIDYSRSHFGSGLNTLVFASYGSGQRAGAAVTSGASSFLVISGSKVYLVTNETLANGNGVRKVDYGRWKDMKMVQIGDHARADSYCSLRCQSDGKETITRVTFVSTGGDVSERMNNVVALSTH